MFDKNMKTVQSHIQIYTEKQNLYQNKNKNIIILALFNFFLFRNTNKNRKQIETTPPGKLLKPNHFVLLMFSFTS